MKDEPTKKDDFGSESSLTYTVLMGGDKVAKTEVGTITYSYVVDTYAIKFVNWDNTEISSESLAMGADIVAPEATPTKAEDEANTYTFAGWYLSTDETQAIVDFTGLKVTGAATYKAKFTTVPKVPAGSDEFTLTFLNADGSTFASTVTVNGAVVLPETEPTKAKATSDKLDWAFVGWYADEALTTKIADATISASTNIYPKFVQTYIVGDINADGKVNGTDTTILRQYVAKKITEANKAKFKVHELIDSNYYTFNNKNVQYANGNINGDNNVNGTDTTILKQYVAKKITEANKAKFGLNEKLTIQKD